MLTRLGAGHPGTATALDNLADLFATVGNYQQALDYFTQALAIREQALGPDHPDNAAFINNLAVLHRSVGNDAEAFRLSQRALAIRQETLGLDHPATATALNNLGTLYLDRGEFQQARQLLEQALEIRERTLGADHPSVAMSLNSLGVLHQSLGSHGEALQLFQRALAIEDGVFKNVFSVASEEQKLLFVQANQWSYNTTLSLVRQHLGNDPEAVRFGLELVLARKGIVQDAEAQTLAALAASLEGAALESWQRLGQHRSNLARLLLSGPTGQDPTAYRQAVAELRTAIATEERFLAQRSARLAQELAPVEPTPAALAQRLPAATVLVEFVRIRGQEAEGGAASEADRYLAFVLTPAGQVTMVDGSIT